MDFVAALKVELFMFDRLFVTQFQVPDVQLVG